MKKLLFSAEELKILGFGEEPYKEGGFYYYDFKLDKDKATYPILLTTDGDASKDAQQFMVYLADYTTKPIFKDKYLDLSEIKSLIAIFGN
jgi:hypothetical protein